MTTDAAKQGAKLVVFPKAYKVSAIFESSVDVPGPAVDRLAKIARQNAVILVVGVIERESGTLYCTVLFFSAEGNLLRKHRTVMPTASERLKAAPAIRAS